MAQNNNKPGDTSILTGGNAPFLDELYKEFLKNPDSVDSQWKHIFDEFEKDGVLPEKKSPNEYQSGLNQSSIGNQNISQESVIKQVGVLKLIEAYRNRGHLVANLDPLGLTPEPDVPDLTLSYNGLSESDLDTEYFTGNVIAGKSMKLRRLIQLMSTTYCGSLGIEYSHITDARELSWLQEQLEAADGLPKPSESARINALEKLTQAEGLEKYLGTKYVGQKRFSLEGGDSLIPLLDDLIQHSGQISAKEIVIGMAHRGRLNVLVNILGKSPAELFEEFEGKKISNANKAGDVKYHMGFSSDIMTPGGAVHLALGFNPSHLEIINPVIEGSVRARQERRSDKELSAVIPILIHGDAAFAGQGVVMETITMAQTRGYKTGGTIHIIVNNQIGFTTSNPLDSRSTLYSTEVAKLIQSPILHVNADDPDAVLCASHLALQFRMKFKRDVVIDLVCYRRHGHNEADEPMVTQPLMYQKIKKLPTTRLIYTKQLVEEKVISQQQADDLVSNYKSLLDKGQIVVGQILDPNKSLKMVDWSPYIGKQWTEEADTTITHDKILELNKILHQFPKEFTLHRQIQKMMNDRNKMAEGELRMDWGFAENLAYANIIEKGHGVRLSGQDCGRGTFFHRHAVIHDQNSRETAMPLQNLATRPYQVNIINSFLSEEAVLGFEYGYSTTEPRILVIWEAQFGDFANGAQVVIDQFISSGEEKWERLSGLVMLLPHGYEGHGPEHSSARLERYLQLCANNNMQVCVPSTPAQMYHMLCRQSIRNFRHPLIVMSPKSLLRHKLSTSTIEDITQGGFQLIIDNDNESVDDNSKIDRLVMCSGKVYFDLYQKRAEIEAHNVAIVRIEQLHPFPFERLQEIKENYPNVKHFVWCQEEPENQGAWYQIRHFLEQVLTNNQSGICYAGRKSSASPAVGFHSVHVEQQKSLVEQALNISKD